MLTLYIADAEKDVSMKNLSQKEAIALLRNLEDALDSYCGLNEEGKTAFRMAIEALNCSEIPNNSDTISRQEAIDALKEKVFHNLSDEFYGAMQVLDELPSVQPERKTGQWIDAVLPNDNGGLPVQVCDQCNTFFPLAYTGGGHHFCPNCGAKMKEGEQE